MQVRARDSDAAAYLAKRRARRVVDVLNFFADLVPGGRGWAYLPGEAATVRSGVPTLGADDTLTVRMSIEGPLYPYSLTALKQTASVKPYVDRVHDLMRRPVISAMEEIVLASVQWAGRSIVGGGT